MPVARNRYGRELGRTRRGMMSQAATKLGDTEHRIRRLIKDRVLVAASSLARSGNATCPR